MFTVCPKCALTLVVTAADLRVAQGYVRCGRCSNVFNALARLSEDKGASAAAQTPGTAPAAPTDATGPAKQQQNGSSGAQGTPAAQGSSGAPSPTPTAPTRPPQPTGSFVYPTPADMTPPASATERSAAPTGRRSNTATPPSSGNQWHRPAGERCVERRPAPGTTANGRSRATTHACRAHSSSFAVAPACTLNDALAGVLTRAAGVHTDTCTACRSRNLGAARTPAAAGSRAGIRTSATPGAAVLADRVESRR